MDDRIYGIEQTVETLEEMAERLRDIFRSHHDGMPTADASLSIEAAKAYASVSTALFNIKASPAWKVSSEYEAEMDVIDAMGDIRLKKRTEPALEQQKELHPEQERDYDGPELG